MEDGGALSIPPNGDVHDSVALHFRENASQSGRQTWAVFTFDIGPRGTFCSLAMEHHEFARAKLQSP